MTANQLTLLRIALLPIPCAMLLFASESFQWLAFFLFVFLGMTDFVDGMMARREGPTKLGGLLDPVADKIMMAAITLSLSANGWIPNWVPVAILSREFLVTVLRSSVALRGKQVKTSTLAKIKTIMQMGGFGTVFMTLFLDVQMAIFVSLFWVLFFVAIWSYWKLVKQISPPYWALPVGGCFLYWFLLLRYTSTEVVVLWICLAIISVTWLSALDYLKTSFRALSDSGLNSKDITMLFWALSHGVFVVSVASLNPRFVLPVLISIAFELSLGGIDNIVVAEKNYLGARLFVATALMGCLFSVVQTQWMALLLVLISFVTCLVAAREVKWRFFPGQ